MYNKANIKEMCLKNCKSENVLAEHYSNAMYNILSKVMSKLSAKK